MTAAKLDAGNRLAKGECSSVARKPVHTHRRVMKHGGALCCRKIFRESLELVPEHGVRTRKPIDREVVHLQTGQARFRYVLFLSLRGGEARH